MGAEEDVHATVQEVKIKVVILKHIAGNSFYHGKRLIIPLSIKSVEIGACFAPKTYYPHVVLFYEEKFIQRSAHYRKHLHTS